MTIPPNSSKPSKESQEGSGPSAPTVLQYRTPQAERPRTSSGWQIVGGFLIYQASIWGLTMTYSGIVPVWKSLTEWLVLTTILIAGSFGVGARWNKWGYMKGIIAAFILTGSCCGLLFSTCGNPFKPLL